jgi:hypothetical protein
MCTDHLEPYARRAKRRRVQRGFEDIGRYVQTPPTRWWKLLYTCPCCPRLHFAPLPWSETSSRCTVLTNNMLRPNSVARFATVGAGDCTRWGAFKLGGALRLRRNVPGQASRSHNFPASLRQASPHTERMTLTSGPVAQPSGVTNLRCSTRAAPRGAWSRPGPGAGVAQLPCASQPARLVAAAHHREPSRRQRGRQLRPVAFLATLHLDVVLEDRCCVLGWKRSR